MSKLEEMLKYVSENNEFYKNMIKIHGIEDSKNITEYPILTRRELQVNRYNMFSDGFSEKYYSKKLIRTHTSGSSGEPVNVYWDQRDYNYATMQLWRVRKKYYGISPSDRVLKISLDLVVEGNKHIYFKDNVMLVSALVFNDVLEIQKTIDLIEKFSPEWIFTYPHILDMLCDCYSENPNKIPSKLKYIETIGERLDDELRKRSQELFNVPVKNFYGSEETRVIGYECPLGTMHIFSDNVFVEISKNECEDYQSKNLRGSLLITSLSNRAMPIIRYELGDYIELVEEFECDCGECSPIIKSIGGRINESFNINGKHVDSLLLKDIIHKLNNHYADPIERYRFLYYKSKKSLQVYLQLSYNFYGWQEEIQKAFISEFNYVVEPNEDVDISFFFDLCEDFKDGKMQILKVLE